MKMTREVPGTIPREVPGTVRRTCPMAIRLARQNESCLCGLVWSRETNIGRALLGQSNNRLPPPPGGGETVMNIYK